MPFQGITTSDFTPVRDLMDLSSSKRAEIVMLRPWLRIGNDRYPDPWFYSKVELVILVQVV